MNKNIKIENENKILQLLSNYNDNDKSKILSWVYNNLRKKIINNKN